MSDWQTWLAIACVAAAAGWLARSWLAPGRSGGSSCGSCSNCSSSSPQLQSLDLNYRHQDQVPLASADNNQPQAPG